ncbi:Uncharacterised protein [Vibrio cholerae]|nr:Uncharacterised protein [Vibrio cholerae]
MGALLSCRWYGDSPLLSIQRSLVTTPCTAQISSLAYFH